MTRPRRRPIPLVSRLVLLAAIWSLAVLTTAGVGLTYQFNRTAQSWLDLGLIPVLDNLLTYTSIDEDGNVTAPPLTDPEAMRAGGGRYWTIAVRQGNGLRVVERSRSLWDGTIPVPQDVIDRLGRVQDNYIHYSTIGPLNQPLRVAAVQTRIGGSNTPVVLLVAQHRGSIEEDIRNFTILTIVAVALISAGLILAVLIQVRVGLNPLFALRREVANIRIGKAERVTGIYPRELDSLSSELNALMAHNQETVERQRTHVGNLAHALKTPISVMMTEASQTPGQLSEVVTRQTGLMQDQVNHHLRRARAAARSTSSGERTVVDGVLDELSRAMERIFQDKGIEVDWDAPDDLCFAGEHQDLQEMAGNVMENACKWAKRRVKVEALAHASGKMRLTVEDDGPGLPPEQREAALKRGTRLDENAPGTGLGLNIVDELTRAYGGTVTLSDSRMGGLKVDIVLPRAEG